MIENNHAFFLVCVMVL